MKLNKKKASKVDALLEISLIKLEKDKYYPEELVNEEDYHPLDHEQYMEWIEDYFDLKSVRSIHQVGDFQSKEKEVKAIKSGYIVTGYKTIGRHHEFSGFTSLAACDIEMVGFVDFISQFEVKQYLSEEEYQTVTFALGVSCHTDWEYGHQECETYIIGKFDYTTGKIK